MRTLCFLDLIVDTQSIGKSKSRVSYVSTNDHKVQPEVVLFFFFDSVWANAAETPFSHSTAAQQMLSSATWQGPWSVSAFKSLKSGKQGAIALEGFCLSNCASEEDHHTSEPRGHRKSVML